MELDWVRCKSCGFTMFKASPGFIRFMAQPGPGIAMEIMCKRCDQLNPIGGDTKSTKLLPDGTGGFLTLRTR